MCVRERERARERERIYVSLFLTRWGAINNIIITEPRPEIASCIEIAFRNREALNDNSGKGNQHYFCVCFTYANLALI